MKMSAEHGINNVEIVQQDKSTKAASSSSNNRRSAILPLSAK